MSYQTPGGYFHIRRWGGGGGCLDLASSLEAKFGARFSQVHQIRWKIWGVLLLQDAKIGKKSQFWGHLGLYLKFKEQNLGYLSPIFLEAKSGTLTWISKAKFGAKPPDLLIWKYPLWVPNFIQTVEIEAILGFKRILVYTLLINKSCNGVIYKMAIFCKFNICPALSIPIGFPFPSSLSYGMGVFISSNFLRPPSNQPSILCRL